MSLTDSNYTERDKKRLFPLYCVGQIGRILIFDSYFRNEMAGHL